MQGLNKLQAAELYHVYTISHNNSHDGLMHQEHFNRLLCIKQSTFSELMFSKFALSSPDRLLPIEFMCCVWNFLSFHVHMMGPYIFFLYDYKNSGKRAAMLFVYMYI